MLNCHLLTKVRLGLYPYNTGLDRVKPSRLDHQGLLVVMDACVGHMELIVKLKKRTSTMTAEMRGLSDSMARYLYLKKVHFALSNIYSSDEFYSLKIGLSKVWKQFLLFFGLLLC